MIVIPSVQRNTSSLMAFRFAKAPYFLFLNEAGILQNSIVNPEELETAAGLEAAKEIVKKKATTVIVGSINPLAFSLLEKEFIEVCQTNEEKTVREVFSLWKQGKLAKMTAATQKGGWGAGKERDAGKHFGGDKGNERFGFNFQRRG